MVDFNSGRGAGVFAKLGGETGADMVTTFDDVCPDLKEYIDDFAFGHVLARPDLSLRDRELAAVASLTAINTAHRQLEVHMTAALNAGCKPKELAEVVLQTFLFAGMPATVSGMKTLQKVLKDLGMTIND